MDDLNSVSTKPPDTPGQSDRFQPRQEVSVVEDAIIVCPVTPGA